MTQQSNFSRVIKSVLEKASLFSMIDVARGGTVYVDCINVAASFLGMMIARFYDKPVRDEIMIKVIQMIDYYEREYRENYEDLELMKKHTKS